MGNLRKEIYMSVKITVSYTEEEELQEVICLLRPITQHINKYKSEEGKYKKAKITIRETRL